MFNLKKAQAGLRLELENFQGARGSRPIYFVYGNSYPIKNTLKNLGFFWFKSKKAWGLNQSRYNSQIESSLKQLGVHIPGAQPPVEQQTSERPPVEQPVEQPVESKYVTQSENFKNGKWISENPELENSYGFPINDGIHTFDVPFEENGEEHIILVVMDRKAQPKESGYHNPVYYRRPPADKKSPLYKIHFIDKETGQEITDYTFVNKKGFIDEENFLNVVEDSFNQIIKGEKQLKRKNIRGMIFNHFDIGKRDDELKDYLFKQDGEWKKEIKGFTVNIDYKDENGDYTGTYPIKVDLRNYNENLKTPVSFNLTEDLELEDKNRFNRTLTSGNLIGVYTVEDFNNRIKDTIKNNAEEIKDAYVTFLKSFPFLESQKETGKASADEIYNLITGGSRSNEFFLQQLKERGYIRPNKRQKQNIGLATPESIKWVVDSEKIKDAIYGSGYLHKMPDFFYSVIAYWVHRKKNNIPVFGSQLFDSINTWTRSMKSFGYEIDWKEVKSSVNNIGSQIYEEIVGSFKQETNTNFNEKQNTNVDPSVLPFLQFAEENEIDTTNAVEENRLKSIYLNLAKRFHPDLNREDEEQEEIAQSHTKRLMELWQSIPENIRNATFNLAFMKFCQRHPIKTS